MKTTVIAALLTTLTLVGPARAVEYSAIATDKSTLSFAYKQMGVVVEGRFKQFSAKIAFDPAKPATAKATLDIELASIDAGSAEADDEVAGKAWFNTKAYPQAKFVSTAVKTLGNNRYELSGKMTIKGRSQDIAAPFTVTAQGNQAAIDGALVLKRADFSIGEGVWADFGTVANEVQIKFHFLASTGK
jgi:polyisoprenoid-binding protein YceI